LSRLVLTALRSADIGIKLLSSNQRVTFWLPDPLGTGEQQALPSG
jgi:hypothetical protein